MIHAEQREAVALVTIDRPDRRNALDTAHCGELLDAVARVGESDARVLVLTGAEGHFCAGADLSTVEDEAFVATLRRLLLSLTELPIPVIAAVDGAALGAGTQLAVACDLRVATPIARFGIPAAKLGLMVDHWTVQRLALLAGQGPARAMLLAAEEVDGESAHRLGLVQRLGDVEEALSWAGRLATLAPLTLAGHKLALNRLEPALDDADVAAARARAWGSADVQEGMAAFRERRAPRFEGR
ncbi:MAG TPA: enoyl-CoA hydratase [Acidimicrobiales bacterium]|nr:enoyl-CoA hydratase [Acidimicrobiales bacterium]